MLTALLIHIVIILNAKLEVYSFNSSGDKRKCQNSKSGLRDPHMAPFDLILHFFLRTHCHPWPCQIWCF